MTITRIQIRRGTAAEWAAANPTLAAGEEGVELDTKVLKIGDGTTPWNTLPPALNGTNVANTPAGNIAATTVQGAINELDTEKLGTTAADTTYVRITPTAADALFPATRLRGDTIDSFTARPNGSSATRSPLEWIHDDSNAYLMHLTGGTNMSGAAALIGMGVDNGGTGLFVNNKKTGVGIKITQNDTISSALAYGLQINASSTTAYGAWFGQGLVNSKAALLVTANVAANAGTKLMEWRVSTSGNNSDVLAGYVASDTGYFVWQTQASFQSDAIGTIPMLVVGLSGQTANLQEWRISGGGTVGSLTAAGAATFTSTITSNNALLVQAAAPGVQIYQNSGGTTNQRRYDIATSGSLLLFRGRLDNGSASTDLLYLGHQTKNLHVGGFNSMGSATGGAVGMPNATAPSGTPTGGGILYVESGALKFKGTSGTITTIAVA